jgi:hypothetical protein
MVCAVEIAERRARSRFCRIGIASTLGPRPLRRPSKHSVFLGSRGLPGGFDRIVIRFRGELIIVWPIALRAVIFLANIKRHDAVCYVGPTGKAIETANYFHHARNNNGLASVPLPGRI